MGGGGALWVDCGSAGPWWATVGLLQGVWANPTSGGATLGLAEGGLGELGRSSQG